MLVASSQNANRILVTGGSGQVGGAAIHTLASLGEVYAPTSGELDLSDADSIRRVLRELRPRWIVNAAAYTAVDKAESEPERAFAINTTAPAVLAEEAASLGAAILHFSTDYVFDGAKAEPYIESDPTNPLNVYGSTKLAGERALASSGAAYLVFRTSWVYGATGKNFLRSILRLAEERERLTIVADQHGAPTWSYDLARMAAHVIAHGEALAAQSGEPLPEAVRSLCGNYHAAGAGETTWYGFASEAVSQMQSRKADAKFATIGPIPTSDYPTPAKRPLNSRLDCTKLALAFGWRMPDWRESLSAVLAELG